MLRKLIGYSIIAASLAGGWIWNEYRIFAQTPMFDKEAVYYYTVQPGANLRGVANELSQAGILARKNYFVWMARWQEKAHRIHAGEYAIRGEMTPQALLDLLVSGKVVQHPFTIIEGWNFKQLRWALAEQQTLGQTVTELSDREIMAKLGYPEQHPEGRFLPDTYHFPRGTRDLEVLKRAYLATEKALKDLWPGRDEKLPLNTPDEALVLASIIEKETAVPDERDEIAGVFVRRLQKKMRLQTDPTVIYGMGEAFDGNLRRKDLRRDTPYNTYTRHGLPPTPIAMPSVAAIRAALHPAPGKTLYFVSKGDGSHYFSETLDEHNQAVVKYQLNGQSRPFSSKP